jgi:FAD/FMN-containing dehydrogenase
MTAHILNGAEDSRAARRDLRRRFTGSLYTADDAGYDEARKALNPTLDARPVIIAEAAGAVDVSAALTWARERQLPFAVQSTGHGTYVPSDGGVLLKTSALTRVLVDPDRGIARVGAGARWSDVLGAAAPFGLAPLSGSSADVGVAGYTLGGGVSWLSRRFGFAADSVLRAEVVTADGRMVTASPDEHPELFWALRGGGGSFGVVTSLEFRLHRVASVWAGSAVFPLDRAAVTLASYREWIATAPDELSTAVALMPSWPSTGAPAFAVRAMSSGSLDALRPLYRVAGTPIWEDFRPASFASTRMPGIAPLNFDLFDDLPDPVIEHVVDAVSAPGTRVGAVEVRHWGGAMARPMPDAGPIGHRQVPLSVIVEGPAEAADALAPYATGGSFLNFLRDPSRVESAYAPDNYRWLQVLKARLDPDNVFSVNHNVTPAPARTCGAGDPATLVRERFRYR